MVDAIRFLTDQPHFTRVRAYRGTQSYIDRIYLTDLAHKCFECNNFLKHDFSSPFVGTDHDPVSVSIGTWALPPPPGPTGQIWEKKDFPNFKIK